MLKGCLYEESNRGTDFIANGHIHFRREMHLCSVKHAVDEGYIGANVGYDQAPSGQ